MPVNRLLDFVQERAGDALRVIAWYSESDHGTYYVRDDLDRDSVAKRLDFVSNEIRWMQGADDDQTLQELGNRQATVQVRDEVVIIRFPHGEGSGLLVSLDVEVARDLHEFVVECAEQLAGEELELGSTT